MDEKASETQNSARRFFQWIKPWLIAAGHLYCLSLLAWFLLYWLTGDRFWWLFLLNNFALYLFLPLPLLSLLLPWLRRRELWLGAALGLLLFWGLYGRLWLPKKPVETSPADSLTVMTFNPLGLSLNVPGVVEVLRHAEVDVIALQELNLQVAEAIQADLAQQYPYQVLEPRSGVTGMGVISRYPLKASQHSLSGAWVGDPQILQVEWDLAPVWLINFHAIPPGRYRPETIRYSTAEREAQARALVGLVRNLSGPVLALGDLNAGSLSIAHSIITQEMGDAWGAKGWGIGGTFPSSNFNGIDFPRPAGITLIPKWLIRIDHVFHSDEWRPIRAFNGAWDGLSDHRPVVAEFVLADQGGVP